MSHITEYSIYDKDNTVFDFVLCARFQDIYCFFSLCDIMLNNEKSEKFSLSDTNFLYDKDLKYDTEFSVEREWRFTEETVKKLKKNNYLKLSTELTTSIWKNNISTYKFVNKKKDLIELFKLNYDNFKGNINYRLYKDYTDDILKFKNIVHFFKYLNDHIVEDEMDKIMDKINRNSLKDGVFIMRSISEKKIKTLDMDTELGDFQKNIKEKNKIFNFIKPYDIKKLYKFFGKHLTVEKNIWIKTYDFPRVCTKKLLEEIMDDDDKINIKGFSVGNICYDIRKLKTNIKEEQKEITSYIKGDVEKKIKIDENYEKSLGRYRIDTTIPQEKQTMGQYFKLTDDFYGLYQNVFYDNMSVIKYLNNDIFSYYIKNINKRCINKNLKVGDKIIGIFLNGVFTEESNAQLREKKEKEKEYFSKNISTYKGIDIWKRTNYPRNIGFYIVKRKIDYVEEEDNVILIQIFQKAFLDTLNYSTIKLKLIIKKELKDFFKRNWRESTNQKKLINSGIYTDISIYLENILIAEYGNKNYVRKFFLEFYDIFKPKRGKKITLFKDTSKPNNQDYSYLYLMSMFILSKDLDDPIFDLITPSMNPVAYEFDRNYNFPIKITYLNGELVFVLTINGEITFIKEETDYINNMFI